MAENVHIGEIAEKLSDELFGEFLWTKVGPTNIDWPCEEHEKHAVKTHPADVVFFMTNHTLKFAHMFTAI